MTNNVVKFPLKDFAENKIIQVGEMLDELDAVSIEDFLSMDLILEESGRKIEPYEAVLRLGMYFIGLADDMDRHMLAKETASLRGTKPKGAA